MPSGGVARQVRAKAVSWSTWSADGATDVGRRGLTGGGGGCIGRKLEREPKRHESLHLKGEQVMSVGSKL